MVPWRAELMTRKNKSDLEVIEAYKQQARSRRSSSKLSYVEQPLSPPEGFTVRQAIGSYGVEFTTDGMGKSKDGKVTVIMKGCKPLTAAEACRLFGLSRVSIPEYGSFKDATLGKPEKPEISVPDKKPGS
jgi:hypothetical protein